MSAKYIMRYFATADDQEVASGKDAKGESMTEVEEQILGKMKQLFFSFAALPKILTTNFLSSISHQSYYGSIW